MSETRTHKNLDVWKEGFRHFFTAETQRTQRKAVAELVPSSRVSVASQLVCDEQPSGMNPDATALLSGSSAPLRRSLDSGRTGGAHAN